MTTFNIGFNRLLLVAACVFSLAMPQVCIGQEETSEERGTRLGVALDAGTTYSRIRSITASGVEAVNLPDDNQQFSLGYYVGGTGIYRLTDRITASLAINYQTQRIRYSQDAGYFFNDSMPAIASNSVISFASHTISIPLEAHLRLTATPSTPFVGLGFVTSYYLGTKESYTVYADSDDTELTSGKTKERSDVYSPWNFFIRAAAGYHMAINQRWSSDIRGSYNFALSKTLAKDALFNVNHKISYAQLGIQIAYSL